MCLAGLLGWAAPAAAEPAAVVPPTLVEGATPRYPEGAVGEAEVAVIVTVDAAGRVVGVVPASGPEAFHAAAVEAGWRLRFAAATDDGEPVQASVAVRFRFAPPPSTVPADDDVALEIDVESVAAEQFDTHARATVGGLALERTRGTDLARSIAGVAGVSVARGTADTSKPIIRGQQERRLLVLFDGVRHESQKWGADHATEIDPFAAGEIGVVKGAAGVRYGPDAIGGVVLVEPNPLRVDPGVDGAAQLVGVSNGRRGVGALRLDLAPAAVPGLALRLEGNLGRGAALSTPDYVLGNTASAQWNLGATARYQRGRASLTLSWRRYDLAAGVFYGASHHSLADLEGAFDAEIPVGAEQWTTSYTLDAPRQEVSHDVAMARGVLAVGRGAITTTYAFQLNRRLEFEPVRGDDDTPQYDFTLRTHSLDAVWAHGPHGDGDRPHEGEIGLSGSFQENVYAGLSLIPNHRAWSGGAFAYERVQVGALTLELGARYDHQGRASFLTESAFDGHVARDTLTDDACEPTDSAVRCDLSFDAGSVSAGALWHAVDDRLDLKLDVSSANRFPNGDELYMNGAAPTSPIYALGDPSLGVETTWGASPTVGLRLPWIEAELSTYANLIDDYIYFAPEIGPDGEPEVDVTIRGTYPRFTYRALNALFYGVDGGLDLGPASPVGVRIQGAVVRGVDRAAGEWLLYVPPDRLGASLVARPPAPGRIIDAFVELSTTVVAEQTRVPVGADLAPPPGAYALVGAALGFAIDNRGESELQIGLEGSNLLNARYREYTSNLRYFADEPGRELRLRLGATF